MNRLKISGLESVRRAGDLLAAIEPNWSWRNVAVAIVTSALALAVVTRYTDHLEVESQAKHSVVNHDLGNKRLHVEKSSFIWTFSLTNCATLRPPIARPLPTNSTAPLLRVFHGEGLYNRPPPLNS